MPAKKPLIDLHLHSTASDGTFSPTDVIGLAVKAGLAAAALTDHDTTAGLAEAATAAAASGLEFVPGCELAVRSEYGTMDILGLWVGLGSTRLQATLDLLNQERAARNRAIAEKLQALGLSLTYDDILAEAGDATVGRPHIARALLNKGYVSSIQEAFDRYLGSKGKVYEPKKVLTPEEAIELLKNEGATVILAHPGIYRVSDSNLEAAVMRFKAAGLDGIEAYYSEHSPSKTRQFLEMARRHGLDVSGGSDFHGANKPEIRVGRGKGELEVEYYVLERLKARRQHKGLPV